MLSKVVVTSLDDVDVGRNSSELLIASACVRNIDVDVDAAVAVVFVCCIRLDKKKICTTNDEQTIILNRRCVVTGITTRRPLFARVLVATGTGTTTGSSSVLSLTEPWSCRFFNILFRQQADVRTHTHTLLLLLMPAMQP
jgi:hypothetical protein